MLHTNRSQHPVLALFLILLFYFAAAPLSWARADNGSDIPTRADVQAQLDTLNKQKDLSALEKLVQQDLTETLETLDKIERIKAETAQRQMCIRDRDRAHQSRNGPAEAEGRSGAGKHA